MLFRALFFCLLALPLPAHAATGDLCLQTFNVYGPAYARNVSQRLARTAKTLLAEPCDAIQFQELWRAGEFRELSDGLAPARLAGLWADTIRGDEKQTGLGSFFAGTVLTARAGLYRANNGNDLLDRGRELMGVAKGYTLLEVALPDRPPFLFVNTHTHPTDEATRTAQMLELTRALLDDEAATRLPVLFTADLNATPSGPELVVLEDVLGLRDAFAESHGGYHGECTYCASNPYSWSWEDRVIDYTLFRPSAAVSFRVRSSEVNLQGDGDPLSDHFGVRSYLQWDDGAAPPATDDVARARADRAATTLERAAAALAVRKEAPLAEAGAYARELAAKIRAGSPPASLLHIFYLP